MTHIVMLSGGASSWAAGKLVAEKHGTDNLVLLMTDTGQEDEETYQFARAAAENIGVELTLIADGRDIWQVYKDVGFMGNSRVDPCSRILKRELSDRWIAERYSPTDCIIYVGIDFTEAHRYERMAKRKLPWVYKAPLIDNPMTKPEILQWAKQEGLPLPSLYDKGFAHANCAGFCIKAGQAHYRRLFRGMPERYYEFERKEQDVYEHLGSTHPFLRITENGERRYVTLREFREQYLEPEMRGESCQIDLFDFGGCGCFSDAPEEEKRA
jgi:3'-phosphoadenosine 5'-phosphosulfate sulfotransferase (PAPS reductase)/FAD synthetase